MKNLTLIIFFVPLLSLSQTINETLFFNGLNREYIVYIPTNYDGSTSMSVLFNFHGGSGYAQDFIQINDMRPIADTAGFIAVYPQGAIDYEGAEPGSTPSTSWLHKAPTTHNDIYFIAAIIDTLKSKYTIDEDRIYACGYSEGGIFTYELACRLNERFAAFASVSGSMLTDFFRTDYGFGLCTPSHPTAVMLVPGTNDFNFHSTYDGFEPYYLSVDEITNYWSNYNNTDSSPIVSNIDDTDQSDGSTVERKSWINGDKCVSVEELKVSNGGHDWPGMFGNMDINASKEVWNFVSRYDINGLIGCNSTTTTKESTLNKDKKLFKTIDLLGKNIKDLKNTPLFYIYDDGTVEKKIILE